ncbi:hypothetical protein COU59_00525 [Candidatus Pacearchaeota archaeon CG10_big_fil_rev_8_21_14_0_10_34_12]|nr:MAG: hypothetical protein COU59_00525 [Candidatus Pacearchaeota archaeon CG10_big_fil_rev_8_21_14_0_10_34_12]
MKSIVKKFSFLGVITGALALSGCGIYIEQQKFSEVEERICGNTSGPEREVCREHLFWKKDICTYSGGVKCGPNYEIISNSESSSPNYP